MEEKRKTYRAALYLRLSRDDGAGESASIGTQRKILRGYAAEHGFDVYGEYVDDGYSGTNFERPEWKRMIADIENRRVNLVITKDLSRLGRDYITAGQYTEIYFPTKGVRYIAVNDGYDSDSPYTDIAPFKNVINEMYARDTSKKIRSAFQAKMREGAFIGNFAPYGYQKDPENKNHLVVDPVTAPVVRGIFEMAEKGETPAAIAHTLNGEGIATPSLYRRFQRLTLPAGIETRGWTSSAVCKMLANLVYLGHIVQGKTTKVSFKSHLTLQNPREEWIVARYMHEPLVSQETFDNVRRRSVARRSGVKTGFRNIFSGIARCATCGRPLSVTGSRRKDSAYNLVCGGYKLYGKSVCTNHFLDYDILYQVIQREIEKLLSLNEEDKETIVEALQKARAPQEGTGEGGELSSLKQRDAELDCLIARLYEDSVSGKLDEARFYRMLEGYETEHRQIQARLEAGRSPKNEKRTPEDTGVPQLLAQLDEMTRPEVLSPELIRRLVEKIEVCQGVYEEGPGRGRKRQRVIIHFRFGK
ncbi:recombinase family protein [Zongyangia hominis]|uniref:Recombinase family protein n=1 Tax=Zongyangia hominis TaxID=2763677 RepID=A0A926ECK7_9FIRM|nr:recombinase family protein [Zongyangia hominis]MBC8569899.1 recombinase family protein [Zongyangia hominis]